MIGIVIVAHGGFAQEAVAALEHVVGAQPAMRAISTFPGDNRDEKRAEISAAAADVDAGDGVVIVTDLFGASPFNLCKSAGQAPGRHILYGMSLPMLIKLAKCRHKALPDAVQAALQAARTYMDATTGISE